MNNTTPRKSTATATPSAAPKWRAPRFRIAPEAITAAELLKDHRRALRAAQAAENKAAAELFKADFERCDRFATAEDEAAYAAALARMEAASEARRKAQGAIAAFKAARNA